MWPCATTVLCAGVPAFTSPSPAYVTSLCRLPRPAITTKFSQFTHRLAQIRVRCAATIVVAARSLVSFQRLLNAQHHQHTLKIRKAPKSNGTAAQSTKAALTQPNVNALRSAHIHLEPSPTPLAPIQSTAASGSTLVSVDTEAFKPFALKRRWYCPYRLKGLPCVHRKKNGLQPGEFNSFQALCQHTDKAHDGGKQIVTPVEADPLPESPQQQTTGMLRATGGTRLVVQTSHSALRQTSILRFVTKRPRSPEPEVKVSKHPKPPSERVARREPE